MPTITVANPQPSFPRYLMHPGTRDTLTIDHTDWRLALRLAYAESWQPAGALPYGQPLPPIAEGTGSYQLDGAVLAPADTVALRAGLARALERAPSLTPEERQLEIAMPPIQRAWAAFGGDTEQGWVDIPHPLTETVTDRSDRPYARLWQMEPVRMAESEVFRRLVLIRDFLPAEGVSFHHGTPPGWLPAGTALAEVQLVRACWVNGEPLGQGEIALVTEAQARSLIAAGDAQLPHPEAVAPVTAPARRLSWRSVLGLD